MVAGVSLWLGLYLAAAVHGVAMPFHGGVKSSYSLPLWVRPAFRREQGVVAHHTGPREAEGNAS